MSTIREQFERSYRYHAEECGKLSLIESALKELGFEKQYFYVNMGTSQWTKEGMLGPYVVLEPRHVAGIGFGMSETGPTIGLVDTTPTLADAAKLLLPKVGGFRKGFDGNSNEITLTAEYKGVRIILRDKPPATCTVEEYEEEVPEAVYPAHTVKKYRLKGDCDPLLSQTEAVSA